MKIANIPEIPSHIKSELYENHLFCIFDVMTCLPKEYRNFLKVTSIADTINNSYYVIQGKVTNLNFIKYPRRILSFTLLDSQGNTCRIFFFNISSYLQSLIKLNRNIRCAGLIKMVQGKKQMLQPIIQIGEFVAEFLPIYKSYNNLKIKSLIEKFKHYEFEEYIPIHILASYSLPDINKAFHNLHFPQYSNAEKFNIDIKLAYQRLALEEIIAYYGSINCHKPNQDNLKFYSINIYEKEALSLIQSLPFQLTDSQQRVIQEIFEDLKQRKKPLSRLLQGDVGSGKTVVMLALTLQIALNNKQSVILTPTLILAEQHYKTFKQYLEPFNIPIVFITGCISKSEFIKANQNIQENPNCVIIGTHAVFQSQKLSYQDIGLIITDEQQRFGVEQRQALYLRSKLSKNIIPHSLIVTATPIPRTLLLCFYNMLDISTIKDIPQGKKSITTCVMGPEKKQELIPKILTYIQEGNQVYWVCPSIDYDNNTRSSVLTTYKYLKTALKCRIGMLHGRMKDIEKTSIINSFRKHDLDLLVATTIVEVGVDIPNANLMIIEDADMLGLAQIHQLRGRVGRGHKPGYCILLYSENQNDNKLQKLMIIRNNNDGFKIAEHDMLLRGSGNILGEEQAGRGQFKVTDWRDIPYILPRAIDVIKKLSSQQIQSIVKRWLRDEK